MWKKDDRPEEFTTTTTSTATPPMDRTPQRTVSSAVPAEPRGSSERATIGRSITVRGDVTGDEDLVIQGRVEGSVDLRQHAVTVGPDGEVIASINGRVVTVEGRVEGNIDGTEQVTLRSSAFVKGDIAAPRVVLENGARFRGLVDMGEDSAGERGARVEPVNRIVAVPRQEVADTARQAPASEAKGEDNAAKAHGANAKPRRSADAEPQLSV